MLVALLTALLFLGGSSALSSGMISDAQDNVKQIMAKNDQRKAALNVLKQMEKRTKAQNKITNKFSKQLGKALSDHDFAIEDFDRMWDDYHKDRSSFQRDLIDLRFELKEHISREEWEKLFPRN